MRTRGWTADAAPIIRVGPRLQNSTTASRGRLVGGPGTFSLYKMLLMLDRRSMTHRRYAMPRLPRGFLVSAARSSEWL